jgi:drug/metabolite transporter (DMT)-like permease
MATRGISLFNALLMLVVITFWGSSFVVVKLVLSEGLTPIAIATFRFLIAGGAFLVFLLFKKTRKRDYRLLVEGKDAPAILFLALSGVTLFFSAQYIGIQMAGASIAAIFVCLLSPILIAALSTLILKERPSRKQVCGMGIAGAGTLIIIAGGTLDIQGNNEFLLGSLILLSTPILWTAYNLMGKRILEKYDPFLVVAHITIVGGLCLVPLSVAEESLQSVFAMGFSSWLAILFLSVTCSLIGYYVWFYVLKRVGAVVTSSFLFAEPLVTVLFAIMFAGERLSFSIVAGGLLIFVGVCLVTRSKK